MSATHAPGPVSLPVDRGFAGVPCIRCGESTVWVELSTLCFRCGSCEQEFTRTEVDAALAAWARVLAWCDLAPAVED